MLNCFLRVAAGLSILVTGVVAAPAPPDRGMWVWETKPLLRDAGERRTFFEFCQRFGINVVAMQVATSAAGTGRQVDEAKSWAALIAEASRRGMRVHALDGDPVFTNPAQHETALAIVDAIVAYNRSVAPASRFFGIHLDIEPYVLPEWKNPVSRQDQLLHYLEVNSRAAERAHAAGLVFGVDIPFWWHAPDEQTGEPVGIVTFRGVRQLTTDHLLDFVDNIGIMAYRNFAAGPDGIITHALDTVRRAERAGRRIKAFVGVETEKVSEGVPDKVTFAVKSPEELKKEVLAAESALSEYKSFAGVAIHRYVAFRRMVKTP